MERVSRATSRHSEQFKSVIVCLNPQCALPDQRFLKGLKLTDHSAACKNHLFGIDAFMIADEETLAAEYPVDPLGRLVKQKLNCCRQHQTDSYADVLIEDFRQTINTMLDDFRLVLQKTMPSDQLLVLYNRIYSLDPLKKIIQQDGSSAHLTTHLLSSHSVTNLRQLQILNKQMDDLNVHLNNIIEDMKGILLHYEKNTIVVRKDEVEKKLALLPQQNRILEVCYDLIKSQYVEAERISIDNRWIRFPEALPNHFKPWVYGEKGLTEGVHKMIVVSTQPDKGLNCGLAVLQHHDLNSYPYAIYKSLWDRVSREFRLISGQEISTFIDGRTEVELTLDLDHKKASIRDSEQRCHYIANLRDATIYHFGIVGQRWSVRILHMT